MTNAAGSIDQLGAVPTERSKAVPWYLYALAVGATSIIVGVLWDISWHSTIGRDTFWTPAHMAMYLGGVLGGLACGLARAARRPSPERGGTRAASVRFWGFRAPLGAWVVHLGRDRDAHLRAVRRLVAQRLRARREDPQPAARGARRRACWRIQLGAMLLALALAEPPAAAPEGAVQRSSPTRPGC